MTRVKSSQHRFSKWLESIGITWNLELTRVIDLVHAITPKSLCVCESWCHSNARLITCLYPLQPNNSFLKPHSLQRLSDNHSGLSMFLIRKPSTPFEAITIRENVTTSHDTGSGVTDGTARSVRPPDKLIVKTGPFRWHFGIYFTFGFQWMLLFFGVFSVFS